MKPLVEVCIKKLKFPGQEKPVLSGIDLSVNPGEFVVVSGPVASGKSVLCHCLTGAVPHFFPAFIEGRIAVDGEDLSAVPLPMIAGTVGYMMQEPQSQIFSVSVEEDVAFGPGNLGVPREEIRQRILEALEFTGLKGFNDRSPENLSGGEAQRAVLAGVLAMKPKLLVLDQPAAELDPAGRKEIYARLGKLNSSGKATIILVTEQPGELVGYGSRFITLEDGRIVRDSALPDYREEAAAATGPANKPGALAKVREETAALENCTFVYPDGRTGCREVNLRLFRGEMVMLMGLNGSGKTSLARHFNGLALPESGTVRVLGEILTPDGFSTVSLKVGFLFQNPDYQIFAASVEEEAAFGLKVRKMPPDEIRIRVARALEITGLYPYRDLHPHRLSRGQRQLLALASVLAGDPEIIIADEPTAGLDRSIAVRIMEHLSRLAAAGKTVLLVTHDLQLAASYAHRMVAMYRQEIYLDFPTDQLASHKKELSMIGLDFGGEQYAVV